MTRKQRTRQHVIADLAVNHVERHALLCGFTVERVAFDYGYDLWLRTYDDNGWIESDYVLIQVKATDHPRVLADQETVAFSIERADLDLWLDETLPVILIVYDAGEDVAYWLYVQAYFDKESDVDQGHAAGSVTVHLPMSNRIDQSAFRRFARYRDDVRRQRGRMVRQNG